MTFIFAVLFAELKYLSEHARALEGMPALCGGAGTNIPKVSVRLQGI